MQSLAELEQQTQTQCRRIILSCESNSKLRTKISRTTDAKPLPYKHIFYDEDNPLWQNEVDRVLRGRLRILPKSDRSFPRYNHKLDGLGPLLA